MLYFNNRIKKTRGYEEEEELRVRERVSVCIRAWRAAEGERFRVLKRRRERW